MKIFYELLIEPFKWLTRRQLPMSVSIFFNKHKVLYAFISLIIAIAIVMYIYAKNYYGW